MKRALDLFSGAGGAARGLQLAGFHVTGVDINPQPRYCGDEFICADARVFPLEGYDLIWASPPCQGYSWTNHIHHCQHRPYPKLIEETRRRLQESGISHVIENVVGAPLINPTVLCGTHFGLKLRRHRLFETSFPLSNGHVCKHSASDLGVYAGKVTRLETHGTAYIAGSGRTHYRPKSATRIEGHAAMGIDWMNLKELSQAIPPIYAKFVASYLPL